jgi:hypothetical protein
LAVVPLLLLLLLEVVLYADDSSDEELVATKGDTACSGRVTVRSSDCAFKLRLGDAIKVNRMAKVAVSPARRIVELEERMAEKTDESN